MSNTKIAFQNELLSRTITEALRVPFYRRRWQNCPATEVKRVHDLPSLPIVCREELVSASDFLRDGARPSVMIHSSGTTGMPFVRFRGQSELEAMDALARRLAVAANGKGTRTCVMFTTAETSTHGGGINIPSQVHPVHISVRARWLIDIAVELLGRWPVMPGLDDAAIVIHGRPRHLAILGRELLIRSDETARQRVSGLIAVGYPLSRNLRTFLRTAFPNARVVQNYSLSEIAGGGEQCSKCGYYHLDAHVIGEVVGLQNDRPLKEGTGRLVLTELFPFSQLQPLIRFDTGDLVRRVENTCGSDLAFEFVGRGRNTPTVDFGAGAQVALSTWRLTELLEELPYIARSPLGNKLSPPYDSIPMGPPYAEVTSVAGPHPLLLLDIGVNFSPLLHPDLAKRLQEEVIGGLISQDPDFHSAINAGLAWKVRLRDAGDYPPSLNLGK